MSHQCGHVVASCEKLAEWAQLWWHSSGFKMEQSFVCLFCYQCSWQVTFICCNMHVVYVGVLIAGLSLSLSLSHCDRGRVTCHCRFHCLGCHCYYTFTMTTLSQDPGWLQPISVRDHTRARIIEFATFWMLSTFFQALNKSIIVGWGQRTRAKSLQLA